MTNDIILNVGAIGTILGWLGQMWPIIVTVFGGGYGILRYNAKKHKECSVELQASKHEIATSKNEIAQLKGQVETLVTLIGRYLGGKTPNAAPMHLYEDQA